MSQLGIGCFIRRDSRKNDAQDHHQGGKVVGDCLCNPQDDSCHKDCQHGIVDTDETIVCGCLYLRLTHLCLFFTLHGSHLFGHGLLDLVVSLDSRGSKCRSLFIGIDMVDERHVGHPIEQDKGKDSQRTTDAL